MGQKKYWKNIGWKNSKFDERHQITDIRNSASVTPMQDLKTNKQTKR